jgi:hypothetical protein
VERLNYTYKFALIGEFGQAWPGSSVGRAAD